jgi:Uma2 family endonuclease
VPVVHDVPWLGLPPDRVWEVLSPATAGVDRSRKLPAYAAAGVPHAWLVNPIEQTLEAERPRGALKAADVRFIGEGDMLTVRTA